ncbi:ankyrin repeat and SOCS box protein 13a.1 isoform X1 [Danio aesculapii]|uniref:ankyrin repeat and SOCS box protein 13a.1 isoform X1 n=1 Tax=Danio aesculapii TaxID=1142201 RepID=UPI0024BF87D6|nr:ankyrin repeat and SOCS box protein 13a.1 isoform X1 [Danio aesculapii]
MELTSARSTYYGDIGHWADRTPVHEAASLGRALQLQRLIEAGASVNIVSVDNFTPLHDACIQAHPNCVKILLEAGAQVDVRTIHGSTPLCHACAAGSIESVKLLVDHGASVNPSLTALTASPLHEACIRVTLYKVCINTVFMRFIFSSKVHLYAGNPDCVKLMIAKGALLEAFDIYFGTPLHAACAKAHFDCALLLLNAGAKVNATKFHETALHHAARAEREDLVELLVEFGGDVNISDNLDHIPRDYTKPDSPTNLCLLQYESNPLSLQQLCRIIMRTMVGTRAMELIPKLDISQRIIDYLMFKS